MSPKSNIEFLKKKKTGASRQNSTAGWKCIQWGTAQGQGEAPQVTEWSSTIWVLFHKLTI